MRKEAGRPLLKCAMLVLCLLMLAACRQPDSDEPVEAPSQSINEDDPDGAKYDFIAKLNGVWVTANAREAGVKESVYLFGHEVDTHMSVTRDGVALNLFTHEVDVPNNTVTFRFGTDMAGERVIVHLAPEDGSLRLTYADGSTEILEYLRDLNSRDIDQANLAQEKPMLNSALGMRRAAHWASTVDCNAASEFRARAVCKNEDLLRRDRQMASRFMQLGAHGVDVATTQAAAIKQLDACNDSACLLKAYDDWLVYIDQNYPAPP